MTQFRTLTWADMNKPSSEALEVGQKEALMELLNMTMEQVDAESPKTPAETKTLLDRRKLAGLGQASRPSIRA